MENQDIILPEQNEKLATRFRGYLPVVVDIETGGFDAKVNPLLEFAAVTLQMDENGFLKRDATYFHHIKPFAGALMNQSSLDFTGIDPDHPFRFAVSEITAFKEQFQIIRKHIKHAGCQRAILVGHNPAFDMAFLNAAIERNHIKRSPFHRFSSIDTAALSAVALGQTVLARAVHAAKINFDHSRAHSAIYDAEVTADLFCEIVNRWQAFGGWDNESNRPVVP